MFYSTTGCARPAEDTLRAAPSALTYVVRLPSGEVNKSRVLILLHGYGSNETDLFSLVSRIPKEWLVVSVRAPLSAGVNQYKWYTVQMTSGQIAVNTKEEAASRDTLLQFIGQVIAHYQPDTSRIVLAGFSQGANMAFHTALTAPDKFAGFACFSGRLIPEIVTGLQSNPGISGLRSFVSHGLNDELLPVEYATQNVAFQQQLGIHTTYCTDGTAHAISEKQLTEFIDWLKRLPH